MDKIISNISILKSIVENSKVIIMITDIEGKILYVNKYFTEVTGYTRKEVLNKNPRFLKSGVLPESFYKKMWGTITKGKTWQGTFINKKKDGTIYYENATISPVLNENKEIEYFVGIKHEVTERENLIDETTKNISHFIPLGVIVTDYEHKIVFINETASKIFNIKRKQALNKYFEKIFEIKDIHTNKRINIYDFVKNTKKPLKIDKIIFQFEKKSIISELFITNIIKHNKVFGHVIMFNDITFKEKKSVETIYKEDIEQLSVFLMGFTHDFNNLLAIASMKLQTAKMLIDKDLEKAKERIDYVEKTIEEIGNLIKDFFETVASVPVASLVNINKLIENIIFEFEKKFPLVEFKTEFENEFTISLDREKIYFTLKSIIKNAIEAQEEKGVVEISVKEAPKEEILSTPLKKNSYIKISIKDYGKGIKKEHLPLLFTPYFTTKDRTSEKKTGLSLAICNFNIKKQGGYIKVITEEGKGSEFIIYLPIK
ncbi:two-component system sensor kinase [Thermotomaculum hydrothermale]|uniref:histidine kinase n=1 Tax=Thermotomaculum hydrothermale TaxID=981385 RepID=A0A7R6PFU9_9BACT|nr:PAS domain S-box protein [Thermotomaculum hydrothermale]BBB32959.1 two-component system sensor kinase [Thermotomaculum hydrothermale]